jgi:cytochrome c-type biogenesis protein CcmE
MRVFVGVGILAVFGTLAFLNFNKTVAPYVPFAEAKAASGAVQVSGFPDHRAARFDPARGEFQFTMTNDDGEVMPVVFSGVKPGNFDQAEKVVVIGRYEAGCSTPARSWSNARPSTTTWPATSWRKTPEAGASC